MGTVLEAEHVRLRQPIAIKVLNPEMLGVTEIVERFEREARAAATLRSRHVVRVTDVEQTPEGVPYIVMELLDGADLESERERRGRLPHAEAVDYVLQACSALTEAHGCGIVHRDLKPANLFLAREDADRAIVKVLDFGISKFMNGEDAKLTSAGVIMGTALYMSPEQIRGDISIDARSDIWSLGVILYELIVGSAPWMGPTTRVAAGVASEPAPDIRGLCPIPEPLAQAIHAMLEKDRSRRPQTIADVVLAIAPYAPVGSVGAEVADQIVRRSQRRVAAGASASSPSLPAATPSSISAFASPVGPPPSERTRLVVSARANGERSTMAATTTTSMSSMIARPRVWGALAGFGMLAIAGVILIFSVARTKEKVGGVGTSPRPPASMTAVTAEPPPAVAKTTAEPAVAVAPSAAVAASASVAPEPSEPARPAASSPVLTRRPSAAGGASATVRSSPSPGTTSAAPTPRPPSKPSDPSPAVNPLFLK
jgi:serine/threonine-protein kinase